MSSPTYPFKFSGYGRKGTAGLFSAFKAVTLEAEKIRYGEETSSRIETKIVLRIITYRHFGQGRRRQQRRKGRQEQ